MGLAPEKASKVIPAQSVNEKLTLVAGLIPDPLCWKWRNSQGYLICHKTMDLGSA
jgi:hypothetical protein